MGFVNFCVITLAQGCVIIALILFIPGLPPDNMEFSAYSVKPTLGLDGLLSINTKLNNAERLFENYIKGPEGLAIFNSEIYTGIRGGKIIKFKNDEISPVLQFGGTCENLLEEEKCGRILGISIHKDGTLYAIDGYYGVFKANLSSGAFENVVTKDEIIEGKPVKFPNAIDIGHDGSIYWTLSSTSHEIHDGLFAILGDGNGRLIKTNPKKKTHEVLIDNLHFANGVVLSQDESFVLVSETAAARVTRYYLKGPKKGQADIFIDGLPGLPDNLKRDSKGGFYIPLVRSVGEDEPHLPFTLANFPLIRKFIVRTASLIELCIQFLNDLYPTRFFKFSIKFIGNLESVLSFSHSKRVTIVRTNSNGDITGSLHSTDGSLAMISDVAYLNGAYYFGSPHNNYLGKVVMAES